MHLYNFVGYCSMLSDKKRIEAYVRSLKKVITPESIVLDLGAGTGIFSILSCDFGAKKVYAVEINQLINLLREVIDERKYQSKIEIIQKHSSEINFEEKANVLISDIHGAFPLFESSIETIIDARKRLLTDDAIIIPKKESIYFAISQAEDIYRENIKQYIQDIYGFSIPTAHRLILNRYFSAKSEEEELLSDKETFAEIDYRTIEETSFSKELIWKINKDGVAHGMRGWFENILIDGIGLSNSIEENKTTYSQAFFPFENEVAVKKGDIVRCKISAVYEKETYIWSWKTKIFGQGSEKDLKADFNQSEIAGNYLDPKTILKQSEYFIPAPNQTAQIDNFILSQINGENMQGDIADTLLVKFPEKFENFEVALEYVSELSQKYSK